MVKIVLLFLVFVLSAATSGMTADKVVIMPLLKSIPDSTSKLIFVTKSLWSDDLGGLSGADAKCNAEAKTRTFSGTFQALKGSSTGRPETRSIHYPLPYIPETAKHLNSDLHNLFNVGPDNPVNSNPNIHAWT